MQERKSYATRIAELAEEQPDGPVLRMITLSGDDPVYKWPELHRRSSQLAGALAGQGLGEGDRIALELTNSVELILSVFAAWKVGATPVPVRWDLPAWELERVEAVIDPKVSLRSDDVEWIRGTESLPVPTLPEVISPYESGICSSGSTGTPKVILRNAPAVFDPLIAARIAEAWMPVPLPETILIPTALYHSNGFHGIRELLTGNRMVILEKFDAARVLDVIEKYAISNFTATPTMLQKIADQPGVEERDLSSLVWVLQGAAAMPPSLVHRWARLIGPEKLLMVYGMSEGLGFTTIRADEWMKHPGTVGRGGRDTDVLVLDEEGKATAPGEIGEIYLRSPINAGIYLGDVPPPKEGPDGFKCVGDLGWLDEDGYLYYADRRVDMIVSGGANVFPAEVEAALIDHPQIADVVVIGLKDDYWGRRVHAVVQVMDPADPPTEAELIAYAKRRLAGHKVPKTVELVELIPRTEATKVNRRSLIDARGG